LFDDLPDSIEDLCNIVHGLVLQKDYTEEMYFFKAPQERKLEADIRYIEKILDRIMEMDNSQLKKPRVPINRLFGSCRDFSLLLVSFLRHTGIPARIRYGFANYFSHEWFEDHVVCEYWNKQTKSWMLVDSELGKEEIKKNKIDFDPARVPRDKFLTSGVAWKLVRDEKADSNYFGVPPIDIKGTWFVFASVVRDLAALNKVELLPWEYTEFSNEHFYKVSERDPSEINLIDKITELSREPGKNLKELITLYRSDSRLNGNNQIISYTIEGKKIINLKT